MRRLPSVATVRWGLVVAAMLSISVSPARSRATASGLRLTSLAGVAEACRDAGNAGRRVLYEARFGPGRWRFAPYMSADSFQPVDLRRNLRLFRGRVQVFPSGLEALGFVGSPDRGRALRRAAWGSSLRVGFFLGFDDHRRSPCLIRPAGVSTMRVDLAYVELVARDGTVVAREDSERLRAWLDDAEHDGPAGTGPRGSIGTASLSDRGVSAPEPWQDALRAASLGDVGRAIGRCHASGLARGAAPQGQLVVLLGVDPVTGQVRDTSIELSSVGDPEEADCIASALARIVFPPAAGGGTIKLSVPIQLAP
jgi:hypothetical protein